MDDECDGKDEYEEMLILSDPNLYMIIDIILIISIVDEKIPERR